MKTRAELEAEVVALRRDRATLVMVIRNVIEHLAHGRRGHAIQALRAARDRYGD